MKYPLLTVDLFEAIAVELNLTESERWLLNVWIFYPELQTVSFCREIDKSPDGVFDYQYLVTDATFTDELAVKQRIDPDNQLQGDWYDKMFDGNPTPDLGDLMETLDTQTFVRPENPEEELEELIDNRLSLNIKHKKLPEGEVFSLYYGKESLAFRSTFVEIFDIYCELCQFAGIPKNPIKDKLKANLDDSKLAKEEYSYNLFKIVEIADVIIVTINDTLELTVVMGGINNFSRQCTSTHGVINYEQIMRFADYQDLKSFFIEPQIEPYLCGLKQENNEWKIFADAIGDQPCQLEYLPTKRSRKWLKSFSVPKYGKSHFDSAIKLQRQEGWHDFRFVPLS